VAEWLAGTARPRELKPEAIQIVHTPWGEQTRVDFLGFGAAVPRGKQLTHRQIGGHGRVRPGWALKTIIKPSRTNQKNNNGKLAEALPGSKAAPQPAIAKLNPNHPGGQLLCSSASSARLSASSAATSKHLCCPCRAVSRAPPRVEATPAMAAQPARRVAVVSLPSHAPEDLHPSASPRHAHQAYVKVAGTRKPVLMATWSTGAHG